MTHDPSSESASDDAQPTAFHWAEDVQRLVEAAQYQVVWPSGEPGSLLKSLFSDPSEVAEFVDTTKSTSQDESLLSSANGSLYWQGVFDESQEDVRSSPWEENSPAMESLLKFPWNISSEPQRPSSLDEAKIKIELPVSEIEKLARARIDHLVSQAVSEQGEKSSAGQAKEPSRSTFGQVDKSKRLRRMLGRAHEWIHEHPPGWGAFVAGILIPVVIPLNVIFGQSPPAPEPFKQQIIIQTSGEPPTPDPQRKASTSGDDPRLMETFVNQLSLQQRAELALGKLQGEGLAGEFLNELEPAERFGLAIKGLSNQEIPQFKNDIWDVVEVMPTAESQEQSPEA